MLKKSTVFQPFNTISLKEYGIIDTRRLFKLGLPISLQLGSNMDKFYHLW